LIEKRRAELERMLFHQVQRRADDLAAWFGINIFEGMLDSDIAFAVLMFHRRHVYEHNGGEADEKYIADSGDTSVRPKQRLRETTDTAHRTLDGVFRMARNLHAGFHEIFRPTEQPVKHHQERLRRLREYQKRP
jgi:hypothetical protein